MSTTTVRIPADVFQSARRIAALQGRTPGDVLADAWHEYLVENREQFAADLEEAAELVRAGDTEGLARHTSRSAEERGRNLARRARGR